MDILDEILSALETEERLMLATIISTSGSTPAATFSKMLVKGGGIISIGTVGGGCMEGDVLLQANRLYDANRAEILTFHLHEDDVEHGLICGGSLSILIEPVTRAQASLYRRLKSLKDEGKDALLVTVLSREGIVKRKTLLDPLASEHSAGQAAAPLDADGSESGLSFLNSGLPDIVHKAYQRQETRQATTEEGELIVEPISGTPSLIIFGGGHVAKFVSRAAAMAGFRISIVDDREKYANMQRFPEAEQTIVVDFSEAFGRLEIRPSTYIVIVTRGHRFDEEVLFQAVSKPVRYIGMIGSRRKVLTTYQHLVGRGVSPELLRRVHAPMGVEIGAVTPEEIGISVVAQLIRVRRGEGLPLQNKSDVMNELLSTMKYSPMPER